MITTSLLSADLDAGDDVESYLLLSQSIPLHGLVNSMATPSYSPVSTPTHYLSLAPHPCFHIT
jgi:hypothetical protein